MYAQTFHVFGVIGFVLAVLSLVMLMMLWRTVADQAIEVEAMIQNDRALAEADLIRLMRLEAAIKPEAVETAWGPMTLGSEVRPSPTLDRMRAASAGIARLGPRPATLTPPGN